MNHLTKRRQQSVPLKGRRSSRRGGFAIVMVLTLLSLTLGLSYAMLRTQTTEAIIHNNAGRSESARNAALAAVSIALRQLHSDSWAGADTSTSGNLSTTQSYAIQYTTGDPSLTPGSPNFDEYPYRITITATGIATDPNNPQIQSKYKVQVITQLVRNSIHPAPAGWAPMATNTLFQTGQHLAFVSVPLAIRGTTRFQGYGLLCWTVLAGGARDRYLDDLEVMRLAGLGDQRPFDSQFNYVNYTSTAYMAAILSSHLSIPTSTAPKLSVSDVTLPAFTEYQLYPGGKQYDVELNAQSEVDNFTFNPDPLSNPLGVIRFTSNPVDFKDNVAIVGTVLAKRLWMIGESISVRSPELTYSSPMRLPAVTSTRFYVYPNASGEIDGCVANAYILNLRARTTNSPFSFKGPILTGIFDHKPPQAWEDVTDAEWTNWLAEFETQLADPDVTPIPYFPVWLKEKKGLDYKPTITIERGPADVIHHWHDWTKPLYDAHPSDGGLRWDVIKWSDLGPA